ncbi:MAG: phosphate/phosphite/phosphonate ABC transporter substrate-binding protein [Mastigocoleus sp. MO_167.B18]|nr:phosphate/phosphite/phosphonate ABC transporter substrate-binding protein [Mastigocoleus sp. MO_167.B18]
MRTSKELQQIFVHNYLRKRVALILMTGFALLGSGCRVGTFSKNHFAMYSSSPDEDSHNQKRLESLKIGVLPNYSPTKQKGMTQALDRYLEKTLGLQVDFRIASEYQNIIDWLVKEEIDIAYLGATSYLEALERGARVKPLVAPIDKYSGRPWFKSVILVKANSSVQSLSDLKGKRVAFVDKFSTSGYLVPAIAFQQIRITPKYDFVQTIYAGTHYKSIKALQEGKVDAAATNIPFYMKLKKLGKLNQNEFRAIWKSDYISQVPIVVCQKLPEELVENLKLAFLQAPNGIEEIMGIQSTGYTLILERDYRRIRKLRKKLNFRSEAIK